MSGFDVGEVYFTDGLGVLTNAQNVEGKNTDLVGRFKEFILNFHGQEFDYLYRRQLKDNYERGCPFLSVELEDIQHYDEALFNSLIKRPTDTILLLEDAVRQAVVDVVDQSEVGEVPPFQVMLTWSAHSTSIRNIKSGDVSRLIKVEGIVVSASALKAKAKSLTLQCRGCQSTLVNIPVEMGLDGYHLPRKCEQSPSCPLDPYFILPEKSRCVDYQILKLQESPDHVPTGEVPRHVVLFCDRNLCERAVPGNRISVVGIFTVRKSVDKGNNAGTRRPYLRVLGIHGSEKTNVKFTDAEEAEMRAFAADPEVYQKLVSSFAPFIYGSEDVKRALACLVFGGSRKILPDGIIRRGDINVLLLGDPGTAKSQLLKFVQECSPVGIYTSGKGSSAAGLTASVNRDPSSRNFVIDGGAMALADGGVVCIDEFDKMSEDDRVAIHEAMEQQTISVAKAGLVSTLNSRCAVLAAANSVYGQWDDSKGDENIDFMPTILSRFDMIFLMKDSYESDITIAQHVVSIHTTMPQAEGLSLPFLRRYIGYCRTHCGPRLTAAAAETLVNRYVLIRESMHKHETDSGKRSAIPITVRQLEAIVRTAEALSRMKLQPFAGEAEVAEALRLFQVSTLNAVTSGSLKGVEGFTSAGDMHVLATIENQIKRRFIIGSQVSEHAIVQYFVRQKYDERLVHKVINCLIRRGTIQYRMQRRQLYRVS